MADYRTESAMITEGIFYNGTLGESAQITFSPDPQTQDSCRGCLEKERLGHMEGEISLPILVPGILGTRKG